MIDKGEEPTQRRGTLHIHRVAAARPIYRAPEGTDFSTASRVSSAFVRNASWLQTPDWVPLLAGAVLGATGVGFGALAAHGLKGILTSTELGWWQTGVQYQLWQAVALLTLGFLPNSRVAAALLTSGTIVFSGGLYVMALTGFRWLGTVVPVGGLLMISGWVVIAILALRLRKAK